MNWAQQAVISLFNFIYIQMESIYVCKWRQLKTRDRLVYEKYENDTDPKATLETEVEPVFLQQKTQLIDVSH